MNIIRRIFGQPSDDSDTIPTKTAQLTPQDESKQQLEAEDSGTSEAVTEELENAGTPIESDSQDMTEAADTKPNVTPEKVDSNMTPTPAGVTRPLEMEPVTHQQQVSLIYGRSSDVGMLRENNQDACFAMQINSITVDDRPDFGFFIVADGMGGHHDGEKASALTVETIAAEMLDKIYVPMLREFDDSDRPTIIEALVSASEKANLAVIKGVPDGGTTLTSVAVVGNLAYLAHVGDSRAYLIHNGEMEQLTRDHSLVQRLIELNQLTPEEAEHHPQKNVLYRAVGQSENLEVERLIRPLPPGSQMMLCSDGLWGLVSDAKMKEIILNSPTPQDACDKLVALANTEGGIDNITVIILKIPSSK